MTFNELELIDPILKAVDAVGYTVPSPIQAQAIPVVLSGKDLLGCAQTGTGKTAAFAIPIIQRLYEKPRDKSGKRTLQTLVLTPTRELALQVSQSFITYARFTGLKTAVIFGGVSQNPQVAALRGGVDILVATPGRLLDLIGQGLCHLDTVSALVLDEADRMLDMGFVHDVRRIIALLPKERQTLLFSATMPKEIVSLAASILIDPVTVEVTPESTTVEAITQSVYFVDKVNKRDLLLELLKDKSIVSMLVFSRTKHGADKIYKTLLKEGITAGAIHGNKSQSARQDALANFKQGKARVLVATDIAERGIDINQLSHVLNFDLPETPETYVHRIGRTGRAGLSGVAISFCDFDEKAQLTAIEKLIRQKIPVVDEHPYPMQVFTPAPPKQPRGAGRGEPNLNPAAHKNSRSARRNRKLRNDRKSF